MFTIFCQINNLKSLVFIKKSHCYTFCFQCWIQINGHHVVFSQQATELKHSLNVKKMASLVSVSNAFHGFTLNQDGTNTILLPRFTSKPILYTKHANKLTRRLDSGRSDDEVTHGAEKKFHVALLYLSTGQIDLTGVPSFMNLPKDCKTIKMFKPENCNEVFLIQTGGWY